VNDNFAEIERIRKAIERIAQEAALVRKTLEQYALELERPK